jgi:hypothetical protein
MQRYSTSHVVLTAVHSRRSCSGHICHIAPEKAQAHGVRRAMGAGVNEKQVGGMLARTSPLTQYLPREYAIVVSSERQAVGTADNKGEELAYLRGGPMLSTAAPRPASATAADGCCRGRNKWRMLRTKRIERAPGRLRLPAPLLSSMRRRTASLKMGRIFVAATSTLRATRSPPIILLARIFWAAPIAARR